MRCPSLQQASSMGQTPTPEQKHGMDSEEILVTEPGERVDSRDRKDVPLEILSYRHSTPHQSSGHSKPLRWKPHLLGTTAKKSSHDAQHARKAAEKRQRTMQILWTVLQGWGFDRSRSHLPSQSGRHRDICEPSGSPSTLPRSTACRAARQRYP